MLTLRVFRRLRLASNIPFQRRAQSTTAPSGDDRMALFFQDRHEERAYLNSRISVLESKVEKATAQAEASNAALTNHLNLRTISDLQTDLKRIQNNLNLRSAVGASGRNTTVVAFTDSEKPEIVADTLRKAHQPPAANLRLGPGVQSVLDAVGRGSFDAPGVASVGAIHFGDVQAEVVAAVTAGGGIVTKTVSQALGTLYADLSKQHHVGVSKQIVIQCGDYTMAEAIAAMSVLLFARRLFGCQLDAVYTDDAGQTTVVSQI